MNGTYFNAPMSTSVSQPAHQSPHLPPALSSQSSSAGVNSGVGMNHIYAIAGISNSNNASGSIAGNVHQNTSAIPVGYFPPAAGVNALQYQNVNEGLYTYTSIPSAATNHKLAMAMGSSGGGMGVMNHHHHHQQQQLLLQQQQQMQLLQMQQPKIKKIVSDEGKKVKGEYKNNRAKESKISLD